MAKYIVIENILRHSVCLCLATFFFKFMLPVGTWNTLFLSRQWFIGVFNWLAANAIKFHIYTYVVYTDNRVNSCTDLLTSRRLSLISCVFTRKLQGENVKFQHTAKCKTMWLAVSTVNETQINFEKITQCRSRAQSTEQSVLYQYRLCFNTPNSLLWMTFAKL